MSGRNSPPRSTNGRDNGPRLTVSQGVTLGLALIIGGLVWRAAEKVMEERESFNQTLDERLGDMEGKFLSREVFSSEMEALRREAGMRQEEMMRRLDAVERRIEGPK